MSRPPDPLRSRPGAWSLPSRERVLDLLAHPSRPWLLYGALALSLAGNAWLGAALLAAPDGAGLLPASDRAAQLSDVPLVGMASAVSNLPVPAAEVPPLPERSTASQKVGDLRFTGVVDSSLSATFLAAEGTSPAALSAVFSRLFVWDVDFRRDLHRGDRVDVLYRQASGTEPTILAARLVLSPGGAEERTLAAYRFKAPGDRYASYWFEDGEEVERRLIEGPLEDYEQVATLLRERPSHGGMDFKTPIGTPLRLPRAGKVVRINWDVESKGQSVEVRYDDGTHARFHHLNEIAVAPGQTLAAGTELGKTGNTGRSAAAHLHYELERQGKVLDPVVYHGTLRRKIQPDALPRFQQEASLLRAQLDGQVAAR